MKKKFMSVICLLLCAFMMFAVVACDVIGAEDPDEPNAPGLTDTEETKDLDAEIVEDLSGAIINAHEYVGSFELKGTVSQSVVYNNQTMYDMENVFCVGYDANSGNTHYKNDANAGDMGGMNMVVFTKKNADGSLDQYDSTAHRVEHFENVEAIQDNGFTTPNMGEMDNIDQFDELMTDVYFTSLDDAIAVTIGVRLSDAADITDPDDYIQFWVDNFSRIAELNFDDLEIEPVITKKEVVITGKKIVCNFSIIADLSRDDITDTGEIDFIITFNDGRLTNFAWNSLQVGSAANQSYRGTSVCDVSIVYGGYDTAHEIPESEYSTYSAL